MESYRGATRGFGDRLLGEEGRARETVYIQKMEKERLEKQKQKQKGEKEKTEDEKEGDEKKPEGKSG